MNPAAARAAEVCRREDAAERARVPSSPSSSEISSRDAADRPRSKGGLRRPQTTHPLRIPGLFAAGAFRLRPADYARAPNPNVSALGKALRAGWRLEPDARLSRALQPHERAPAAAALRGRRVLADDSRAARELDLAIAALGQVDPPPLQRGWGTAEGGGGGA